MSWKNTFMTGLRRSTALGHGPVLQGHDPGVGHAFHDLAVMGGYHDRGSKFMKLLENIHHAHGQLVVEVARGFIGQKQLGFDHHGPGHGHALLLAAGKLLTGRAGFLVQMQASEHGADPLVDDMLRDAAHLEGQGHIGENGLVSQDLEILENHAHVPAQQMLATLGQGVQIIARHIGLAPLHGQGAVQDAHEGRLARSRRPAQEDKFPLLHAKIDVLEGQLACQRNRIIWKC
jgi:hypothetical protein